MTSKHKQSKRVEDPFSLEEILSAFDSVDPGTKINEHAVERNTIDLNDIDIIQHVKKVTSKEEVKPIPKIKKIPPKFDGPPAYLIPSKTEKKVQPQKAHSEKHQQTNKQYQNYHNKTPTHELYKNANVQRSKDRYIDNYKPRQNRGNRISSIFSQNFSITFQERMVYSGVSISIKFDNYKEHQSKVGPNSILIVPFTNLDLQTYLVNDIQKRTSFNIRMMLEEHLDHHRQSDFRNADVVSVKSLHNIPYSNVLLVKTPGNDGLPSYLIDKLFHCVEKLIQRTENQQIQQVIFGEWMWGLIEPYQVANTTLKGIIEGVKSLNNKKSLQSIELYICKKKDYQAYSKAFRDMTDQYLEAFYRQ